MIIDFHTHIFPDKIAPSTMDKLCSASHTRPFSDGTADGLRASMRQAGIEPKRLRMVQQRGDSIPWLFLVEGKKGSKAYMQVEAPLLIEGEGGFSREVLDIYQKKENL